MGDALEMDKLHPNKNYIEKQLNNRGFPYAKVSNPILVVNHLTKLVNVTYLVTLGQYTLFGPVTVAGNKMVSTQYILNRLTWQSEQPYSLEKVNNSRQNLLESSLFSGVSIKNDPPNELNQAPIHVNVEEDKMRYWGGGLNYSTSTQFGGRLILGHNYLPIFNRQGGHLEICGQLRSGRRKEVISCNAFLTREILQRAGIVPCCEHR